MWPWFLARPRWLQILLVAGLLSAAAYGGFRTWLWLHDKKVVEKHEAKVTQQIEKKTTKARDRADVQRVHDQIVVTKIQKENYDAIEQAPAGVPGPAHVQLGCLRLRRAGATELPAACGAGGDLEASADFGDRH